MTVRNFADGAGKNTPNGVHYFGSQPAVFTAGDAALIVPVWKDSTGIFDHYCLVTVLTASTVAVVEVRRSGNDWIHDGVLGRDASVTLNFTAANAGHITAFAIDSPGASSNRILFIAGNNDDATDTYEVDSIDLNDGEGLVAIAVSVSGANQPTDTNTMSTVSCAASATSLLTIFEDDGHTAVIGGDETGFTFTYTVAKVTAIDTTIGVTGTAGQAYSLLLIGTQLLLLNGASGTITGTSLWEMDGAFALADEFVDAMVGGIGEQQPPQSPKLVGINGSFAITHAVIESTNQPPRHTGVTFDLDSLVANS